MLAEPGLPEQRGLRDGFPLHGTDRLLGLPKPFPFHVCTLQLLPL